MDFPGNSAVKNPPAVQKTGVQSLGRKEPLGTKWQPTPGFLPGNPVDRGAQQATVYVVAKSQT